MKSLLQTVILLSTLGLISVSNAVAQDVDLPEYSWHTLFYNSGQPLAQTVDDQGNIIVAGVALSSWLGNNNELPVHAYATSGSVWMLKLDENGNYLWHTFFGDNSTVSGYHYMDLATDAAGDIFVTGNIHSGANWNGPNGEQPLEAFHGGNIDGYIAKISSSGQYQWHRFIGPNGPTSVEATHAVAVDSEGYVYTANSDLLGSLFVSKFASSGASVWQFTYGSAEQFGRGDIHIDGDDAVFVTFRTSLSKVFNGPGEELPLNSLTASNPQGFHVLKLDKDGTYAWHTFHGGQVNGNNLLVTSTSSGDIYVVGDATGSWLEDSVQPLNAFQGTTDMFVVKLDADGAYQWHNFWGGHEGEARPSIGFDDKEHLVVSGSTENNWLGPNDAQPLAPLLSTNGGMTVAMDGNGVYLWHSFVNSPIEAMSTASSSIVLTGDGRYQTDSRFLDSNLLGEDLRPPLSGEAIAEGLFVLRYSFTGATGLSDPYNVRLGTSIFPNYPNPFSSATTITVDVDRSSDLILEVYDAIGRRVATIADGQYAPGRYSFEWTASDVNAGLYVARLSTNVGSSSIRMIVAH